MLQNNPTQENIIQEIHSLSTSVDNKANINGSNINSVAFRNALGASEGIWPINIGGTGNTNGTIDKLTTARTIQTNLASTSTASFDGSADITPGVFGVLPIENGGTSATTAIEARNNLGASSGIWSISSGGTSLSTNPSMLINLASENVDDVFKISPRPGITGVLPLNHGGTGGTDSGWLTLTNSSVFTGTIYYRRVGVFLFVQANGIKLVNSLSSLNNVTLATLPDGFHPYLDMVPTCFQNNANLQVRPLGCRIVGDGRIFIYTNNQALETSNTLYFSGFCYARI